MNQWKTFLNYADELHEKNLTHFKKVGSVSKNFGSIFQQFTKRKIFDPEPLPSPDDFTNV